jgi:hypothetical protein
MADGAVGTPHVTCSKCGYCEWSSWADPSKSWLCESCRKSKVIEALEARVAKLKAENDIELASLCDFVNMWAREANVEQCAAISPSAIKSVIDRLWSRFSIIRGQRDALLMRGGRMSDAEG